MIKRQEISDPPRRIDWSTEPLWLTDPQSTPRWVLDFEWRREQTLRELREERQP